MPSLESRPVVAVIPHYNMPQTLVPLLKQVLKERYYAVYVLDDNSLACDITKVLAPFGASVKLIAGTQNVGAGQNRNRILEVDPKFLEGSILHFMDADVELLTRDVPKKARKALADPTIGEVGGLIVNRDGLQYSHNYNPRISLSWCFKVALQGTIGVIANHRPRVAKKLRWLFRKLLTDFPDMFAKPAARDVWCPAEANTLVLYDTFAAVGGFNHKLRFQEAQDLAYRLEAVHLRRRFDPTVAVRHLAIQVRGKKRNFENLQGIRTVAKEHGLPLR